MIISTVTGSKTGLLYILDSGSSLFYVLRFMVGLLMEWLPRPSRSPVPLLLS